MTEGQEMAAGGLGAQNLHPGRDERATGKEHRWTSRGGRGDDRMQAEGLSHFLCTEDELDGFLFGAGPSFLPPATSIQPQAWHPEDTQEMCVDSPCA